MRDESNGSDVISRTDTDACRLLTVRVCESDGYGSCEGERGRGLGGDIFPGSSPGGVGPPDVDHNARIINKNAIQSGVGGI